MDLAAIDTETHLIAPGLPVPRFVSLGVGLRNGDPALHLRPTAEAAAREVLEDPNLIICGHHIPYDFGVLARAFPALLPLIFAAYEANRVWDTRIAAKLLAIHDGVHRVDRQGKRPRFTLAACVERAFGHVLGGKSGEDAWRLRYAELDDGRPLEAWPAAAVEYAIEDVRWTAHLAERQRARAPHGRIPTIDTHLKSGWALHLMSAWGVMTDADEVQEVMAALRRDLDLYRAELQHFGLVRPGGTRNMEAVRARIQAWADRTGTVPITTATGLVSSTREVLENTDDTALLALADYGKVEKVLSTYGPVLAAGTKVPLCASYEALVESGRTSCRRPNLQNLPRKGRVRTCFVPRPGFVYAAADYAGAELLTLAEVCEELFGTSAMGDALRAGLDLHIQTAASALGIGYETAKARLQAGDPEMKKARQRAKVQNFGLPGGLSVRGAIRFARGFGIDLSYEESAELREQWFTAYPEVGEYFVWINEQLHGADRGTIKHPVSGYVRGGCSFTEAANFGFQHLAALGAKEALWLICCEAYGYRPGPLTGSRPVVFVHDEVLVETPAGDGASDAADRLGELMVKGMEKWVKRVPVSAEAYLMNRWEKDARPVRRPDGRLVAWAPDNG